MADVLVVESRENGARLAVQSGDADHELGCWSDGAPPPDLSIDAATRSRIERIELKVRDKDLDAAAKRVGVILVGVPPRAAARIPTTAKLLLAGAIDVEGFERSPLNEAPLDTELPALLEAHALEAFVVSGMNSHRNPVHEARAAASLRARTECLVLEARFWSDVLSATARAGAAQRAAAFSCVLTRLLAIAEGVGISAPVRSRALPAALIAALLRCPRGSRLVSLAAHDDSASPVLQATITRSDAGYSCHCPDDIYTFDSITQAKAFAAEHLKELIARAAEQLQLPPAAVRVTTEDRYTQVRGRRGLVRVYLRSVLTAFRES